MKRLFSLIAVGSFVVAIGSSTPAFAAEPRVGSTLRVQAGGSTRPAASGSLHTLREAQQAERRLQLQRAFQGTSGASETDRQRAQLDASHLRKEIKRLAADAARDDAVR